MLIRIDNLKNFSEKETTGCFVSKMKIKYWFLKGELHRESGSAIEWPNGIKEWFLNGRFIKMEEWPIKK